VAYTGDEGATAHRAGAAVPKSQDRGAAVERIDDEEWPVAATASEEPARNRSGHCGLGCGGLPRAKPRIRGCWVGWISNDDAG